MATQERPGLFEKLRNKYRLVILNDDTFEEKISFKLSRLNVFILFGLGALVLIAGTTLLIAFTPLREYIPGYASTRLRRQAFELSGKTDSIENQLAYTERYLQNLRNIISGKPAESWLDSSRANPVDISRVDLGIAEEDSLLRVQIEREERYNLGGQEPRYQGLSNVAFFTPVKGVVSNPYDSKNNHLAVDVVAKENEPIKSCLDGMVVFAQWTTQTGHVLIVQHSNDLLSVYKHNSALLKEQGDFVRAGEVIAIIGNSGELTTGPHLHFELWHRGNPVNPQNYIAF